MIIRQNFRRVIKNEKGTLYYFCLNFRPLIISKIISKFKYILILSKFHNKLNIRFIYKKLYVIFTVEQQQFRVTIILFL